MKNKLVLLVASFILLFTVLGCSWINPFASSETSKTSDPKSQEKSTSDKVIESTLTEKTGVAECDELREYISQLSQSKDDDYFTKATREVILNRIMEGIKKSVEENKNNPEELAKLCKDYKNQLERFKTEEDTKNAEK